jgi:hypothetical protein
VSRDPRWLRWLDRAYGTALRLYPRRFRAEWGEAMRQHLRDRGRALAREGRGPFALLAELLPDVAASVPRERHSQFMELDMRRKALVLMMLAILGGGAMLLALGWALDRQNDAWVRRSNAASREAAQALAARGDVRSLLAAALLWPRDTGAEAFVIGGGRWPQPAQAWLDAARFQAPTDTLVNWLEVVDCHYAGGACTTDTAVATLLRHDGDNAAAHLLALDAAHRRKDAVAVRRHLQGAAAAPRLAPYHRDLQRLVHEAHDGMRVPPLPAAVAKLWGMAYRLDRPASAADFSTPWFAHNLVNAYPMPSGLLAACRPADAALDPALDRECRAVLARLAAADDAGPVYVAVGLQGMVRLTVGDADGAAWRERLRRHYWQQRNASHYLGWPGKGLFGRDRDAIVARDGEMAAWREALRRAGVPLDPPAGWRPGSPMGRALVETGRDPPSE